MNEQKNYQRKPYDYQQEEDSLKEEIVIISDQPIFIPFLVIALSAVFAYVAIKSFAPIAERFVSSRSDAVVVERDVVKKPRTEGKIASFFSPEVKYWQPYIEQWAKQYQLDPNLIATVIQIESCGDANAISTAGAMGLFQVMPYHFEAGENAYDPQVNAKRGLAYLRKAYQAVQGDIRNTLASYNGGIYGASQPESLWSEQMHRYVKWGMGIYQDAIAGRHESETLNEWLAAGGSRLCEQARNQLIKAQGNEEYSYNSP